MQELYLSCDESPGLVRAATQFFHVYMHFSTAARSGAHTRLAGTASHRRSAYHDYVPLGFQGSDPGTTTLACLHTPTHTHMHTFTHTYTNTHTHTYTHIQTNTHTHTYKHTHIQTHTYTNKQTHTHTYTHIYQHTHIHTYTNTHIYTHLLCHFSPGPLHRPFTLGEGGQACCDAGHLRTARHSTAQHSTHTQVSQK